MRLFPPSIDLHFPGFPNHSSLLNLTLRPDSSILPYSSQGYLSTTNPLICPTPPPSYYPNHGIYKLGNDLATFSRAASALYSFSAFNLGWARAVHISREGHHHRRRKHDTVKVGDAIVFCLRVIPGLWWTGVNKIIAVEKNRRICRIVWGTSKRHALLGEELVEVVQENSGKVKVRIQSFSKPGSVMAWIIWPYVRLMQRRFVKGTFQRMVNMSAE